MVGIARLAGKLQLEKAAASVTTPLKDIGPTRDNCGCTTHFEPAFCWTVEVSRLFLSLIEFNHYVRVPILLHEVKNTPILFPDTPDMTSPSPTSSSLYCRSVLIYSFSSGSSSRHASCELSRDKLIIKLYGVGKKCLGAAE